MEPGRTCNVKAVLLAIYLNDHLAGATAGRELARRSAASNRASSYGSFLADLAVQISEDRQSLIELMGALDVRIDRFKVIGARAVEKAERLKLNGSFLSYSPLSRVLEIEGLTLGVNGKLALWGSLQELKVGEPRIDAIDLALLIERGQQQLSRLESERLRAVTEAF